MSVIVKDMEMPKTCFECDLYNDESNFCKAQKEYLPFASFGRDYKCANCPLVELPEKHGDLIDRDKLEVSDGWLRSSDDFTQDSAHNHITFVYSNAIAKAPVVVEAEGSE